MWFGLLESQRELSLVKGRVDRRYVIYKVAFIRIGRAARAASSSRSSR